MSALKKIKASGPRRGYTRYSARVTVDYVLDVRDDLVAEVMTPDWQSNFFKLNDGQAVAEHVAFNLARGDKLTNIDGFAQRDESDVLVVSENWDVDRD